MKSNIALRPLTDSSLKKSEDEEDRISELPDELIHIILSFIDTKLAIQTSVLSRRWKHIWTTLPFLSLRWTPNLTRHVLNHRDHQSRILHLELVCLAQSLAAKFVKYAICHRVEHLNVILLEPFKFSDFSSDSIEKLELKTKLEYNMSELDCWDLPSLTTLHLTTYYGDKDELQPKFLSCLPALRTLGLNSLDLESSYFNLPDLTTLLLKMCKLPTNIWNLPALKSLTLDDVEFPENMNDIFAALVSLQNLTLSFCLVSIKAFVISCPELVNLEIKTRHRRNETPNSNIVVLAPKLRNFASVGIFTITMRASKLEYVNIKLQGWIEQKYFPDRKLKEYYQPFIYMLPRLGSAKILNLDSKAIEALSMISDFLANFPSPFYNLNYVKVPHGCEEASIPSTLRSYLVDGSPTATIVTTLAQVSDKTIVN